ncbi:MAG: hypothetical protein K5751_12510 [Treponemataceae bacterium]|nr:hypothetical protein [Treponemataceae bacterium]
MSGEETGLAVIGRNAPAVTGTMEEEHFGDGFEGFEAQCSVSVEIQDMFRQLVLQSNFAAHEAEAKLQVEEKGNNVADLQGFCAGIRKFKSVAKDAGFDVPPALFDTANRMTPWVQKLDGADGDGDGDTDCELSLDTLTEFSRLLDELTASNEYAKVRESMQNEIKEKKDYLYAKASSSRELFWTHGWHRGFSWVEGQIKELYYWKSVKEQQAERLKKEKESELPFGNEED